MATATRNKRRPAGTKTPAMLHIEQWLDEHNASYEYDEDFQFSELDTAASHRNQARVVPLMDDVVLRYAVEMEQGDEFPPLVVYKTKTATLWTTIDGNQRAAAAEAAGRTGHPAYKLLDPPKRQVELLIRSANKEHGQPQTDEERLLHAAYLVESQKTTQADAARQTGIGVARLGDFLRRRETEQRMARIAVRNWEEIPPHLRTRVGSIKSDPVLKEAAQLIVDAGLTGDEADQLVTSVNRMRSERDALDIVKDERGRREVQIKERGGVRMPQELRSIARGIGILTKADVDRLKGMELSDDYKAYLRDRIEEGKQALDRIAKIAR